MKACLRPSRGAFLWVPTSMKMRDTVNERSLTSDRVAGSLSDDHGMCPINVLFCDPVRSAYTPHQSAELGRDSERVTKETKRKLILFLVAAVQSVGFLDAGGIIQGPPGVCCEETVITGLQ